MVRDHFSGLQIGLDHTLPKVIAHVAEGRGYKPFSIDENGTVTSFADLKQRVAGLGSPLLQLGVVPGDRSAILAPNSTAWIVAACAAESIGALMLPINTRFKGPEIGTPSNARGRLRILDLLKDVVIVGGFNAYPLEIEIMMTPHPDIAEIAVIGVPDERLGEVTTARVIHNPGDEITLPELTRWCREDGQLQGSAPSVRDDGHAAHPHLTRFKSSRCADM